MKKILYDIRETELPVVEGSVVLVDGVALMLGQDGNWYNCYHNVCDIDDSNIEVLHRVT